jgi:hypothetical protein
MGSTKDLHGIAKGTHDNASTMPTLPKQTLQLFGSTMALMTFLQQMTKIFSIDPFKSCEFGFGSRRRMTQQWFCSVCGVPRMQ